jgi:hypothetical protein
VVFIIQPHLQPVSVPEGKEGSHVSISEVSVNLCLLCHSNCIFKKSCVNIEEMNMLKKVHRIVNDNSEAKSLKNVLRERSRFGTLPINVRE